MNQSIPNSPTENNLQAFFAHLWRGGRFANLWLRNRSGAGRAFSSYWFDLEESEPTIPQVDQVDVYFSVHPLASIPTTNMAGRPRKPVDVRSQLPHLAAVNCLFAEFDADDFGGNATLHVLTLEPSPSVVIRSSAGSYHAYWLLDSPFLLNSEARRDSMRRLQAEWVNHVGGDPGAADLARVLRVPDTLNWKYAPAQPVEFMTCHLERLYSVKTLAAIPASIEDETPQPPPPLAGHGDFPAWIQAAIRGEVAKLEAAPRHAGHHTANRSAFKLGQIVDGFTAMRQVENALFDAYKRRGLHDNSEAEIRRTIRNGVVAGNRSGNRRRPAERGRNVR